MGFRNFRSHKDSSHKDIVDALQGYGWTVKDVSIVPHFLDLLIEKKHDVWGIEAKGVKTTWKVDALRGFIKWTGKKAIIRTKDEAFQFHRLREAYPFAVTTDLQNFELTRLADNAKGETIAIRAILDTIEKYNAPLAEFNQQLAVFD